MNVTPAQTAAVDAASSPIGFRVGAGSLQMARNGIAEAHSIVMAAIMSPSSSDFYPSRMRAAVAPGGVLPVALDQVLRATQAVASEPGTGMLSRSIRTDVHDPLAAVIEGVRQITTWGQPQYQEVRAKLEAITDAADVWSNALQPSVAAGDAG